MSDIIQNTLYLTTPGSYVARDHLTLQVEVPVYPDDLPLDERTKEKATGTKKVAIPIHHLESICVFGPSTISPVSQPSASSAVGAMTVTETSLWVIGCPVCGSITCEMRLPSSS